MRWAIHQYSTQGVIDRDVAKYHDLAAMQPALGKVPETADFTTKGRKSLIHLAKTHGVLASTIRVLLRLHVSPKVKEVIETVEQVAADIPSQLPPEPPGPVPVAAFPPTAPVAPTGLSASPATATPMTATATFTATPPPPQQV